MKADSCVLEAALNAQQRKLSQINEHAPSRETSIMNKLLRAGIAGFAAWKWGGGLIGTILLFVIVFYLLGYL